MVLKIISRNRYENKAKNLNKTWKTMHIGCGDNFKVSNNIFTC